MSSPLTPPTGPTPTDTDPLMGTNDDHPKDEYRRGDSLALYVALTSALVLLLTTWTIILSNDPKTLSWFAFHPSLNTFAVLCFTYGVLTLQPTSQPKTKAEGLDRHQTAMGIGLTSILLGTTAIYNQKASHHAPHITSWHATFGLTTVSWLILQALIGGGSVWFGGAAFGGGQKAKRVWKYHRLSGYILLLFLLTTVHLGGGWSEWVELHTVSVVRLIAYVLAPLGILVSIYSRVRASKMKFY
ncbi:hypothetical protein F5148DRAFT_512976 [Russula earlei]|uniref:Uncharacterized protein n=1 Tax=Russula earlei TaxID=71964 RepID=A0ACC0TX59_9AGAM|nr:hypothetical protein F5148DRAFT_512976 [Russula earlei]